MSDILKRETYASYEGAGGWADGRLGAAYDLVCKVRVECEAMGRLEARQIMHAIEALDALIGSIER